MSILDGLVEIAYFVTVEGLREICNRLTTKEREYKVVSFDERAVTIHFNDGPDDLNSLTFSFPIVVNLQKPFKILGLCEDWPFGEDGFIACLHIYTATSGRGGLYLENGKLWRDGIEDWERFWPTLKTALHTEIKKENERPLRGGKP